MRSHMLVSFSLPVLIALVFGLTPTAKASLITYTFTGTGIGTLNGSALTAHSR